MSTTAYFVRYTPQHVVRERTVKGAAKLKARGVIENKLGLRTRTAVCYGHVAEKLSPFFRVGQPILVKGVYERVRQPDGSLGGEFFRPVAVIRAYDPPAANDDVRERAEPTGRSVAGHDRKETMRWQWCGKGRTERRRVYVRGCKVNGGRKAA